MTERKVAFVTGAGSGIGCAIALKFAQAGYAVAIADLRIEAARQTAAEITGAGGDAVAVNCDVTNLDSVETAVNETCGKYHRVDVLVNNAGWDRVEPFLDSEPETWDAILKINLLGHIHTCKVVLPLMIEQGGGRVINIASDAGRVGSSGEAVYSAAKGGVIALTKTLAREMARHQITLNVVSPGPRTRRCFTKSVHTIQASRLPLRKPFPYVGWRSPRI